MLLRLLTGLVSPAIQPEIEDVWNDCTNVIPGLRPDERVNDALLVLLVWACREVLRQRTK